MRADRLLAILMILQTRGRTTAKVLAGELEVSERTIYRDVTALSTAGVPVYTERGPGGGITIVDDYRTSLTGLTEEEVKALFMLNTPMALTKLGVGKELKTALLKLAASLPSYRKQEEELVRKRIYLDSEWWFQNDEPVPHLQSIQEAIWHDRKLTLKYGYKFAGRQIDIDIQVDPYGLVAKTSIWHLVCAVEGHTRVVRVSNVIGVQIMEEKFERPLDFDLVRFWKDCCVEYEARRSIFPVQVRVAPELIPILRYYFGDCINGMINEDTLPDENTWLNLTLHFDTFEAARNRILGFGKAIEILEPRALRESVIDFSQQIVEFYRSKYPKVE